MKHPARWLLVCIGCLAGLAGTPAHAEEEPQAQRPILVHVDASETWSGLIRATLDIPVTAGPVRLHYPKWLPGHHVVSSAIRRISHLAMRAGERRLDWKRDARDPWSFACTIPEGTETLTVELALALDPDLQVWSPRETLAMGSRALLHWGNLLLYPSGWDMDAPLVRPRLRVPEGWSTATSLLQAERRDANGYARYRDVSLEELVDSPVVTGRHVRSFDIPVSTTRVPHRLTVCANRAADLPRRLPLDRLGRALEETHAILGEPPTDRYDFLLLVSDPLAGAGNEHLRSSVNFVSPGAFKPAAVALTAETLVHEYVHVWNGKRHLPKGVRVDNLQQRPDFRMLWVYEGLTSYLTFVIARRSGLWSDTDLRWRWAFHIENTRFAAAEGSWRSLEDIAATAPLDSGEILPWERRRRTRAHYWEAAFLWLEVDAILRRSKADVSLDTFCRRFLGGRRTGPATTYEWEDVVHTLSGLFDADWERFFQDRVRAKGVTAPLKGLRDCGWTVRYADMEPGLHRAFWTDYRRHGPRYACLFASIGAVIASNGTVLDVVESGPVYRAKLGPGARIKRVNDEDFDLPLLMEAVGKTLATPLALEVQQGDELKRVLLDYDEGHRMLWLERLPHKPDLLKEIFAPRAGK